MRAIHTATMILFSQRIIAIWIVYLCTIGMIPLPTKSAAEQHNKVSPFPLIVRTLHPSYISLRSGLYTSQLFIPLTDHYTKSYSFPLHGEILRPYEPPHYRWMPGHRGVDIDATNTRIITAPSEGIILWIGIIAGIPSLSIDHGPHKLVPRGEHLRTTYSPVESSLRTGDSVYQGQSIGTVLSGHPGCPRLYCLHWGAKYGSGHQTHYINPLRLIYDHHIVLLP